MLLAIINILIIVVVGAILFWVIDKFVRDGPARAAPQAVGRPLMHRGHPPAHLAAFWDRLVVETADRKLRRILPLLCQSLRKYCTRQLPRVGLA
jgi:hypothetical protein